MLLDVLYLAATLATTHPHYLPAPEPTQIIEVVGRGRLFYPTPGAQGFVADDSIITCEEDPGQPHCIADPLDPSADAGWDGTPLSYTIATECQSGAGCTALYISPAGSGSACTIGSPCASITQANSTGNNDDFFIMRGGTYSLGAVCNGTAGSCGTTAAPTLGNEEWITDSGINLWAYPGETVIIDGAANYTAGPWTDVGTTEYVTYIDRPCTQPFIITNFCSGGNITGGDNAPGEFPDQAWIDGVPLRQESTLAALNGTGEFFVDITNNRMYLWEADKDGATLIEACGRNDFLSVSGANVHIRGITVKRMCNPINKGALIDFAATADGCILEDSLIQESSSFGVFFTGDQSNLLNNCAMTHVTFQRNLWTGALVNSNVNLVVDGLFCQNTDPWNEYASSPSDGCIKYSKTYAPVIKNSRALDNRGHVFWFDESVYNPVVANSTIINNGAPGESTAVFFELTDRAYAINNLIISPASNPVKVAGSTDFYAINNTLIGGPDAIGVYTDNRSQPTCSSNGVRTLTGTVAYSAGTTLTGTGTKFLKEVRLVGAPFTSVSVTVNGQNRFVSAVASETSLTVTAAFTGSASGLTATHKWNPTETYCSGFSSNLWTAPSPPRPVTMTWGLGITLLQNNIIGPAGSTGFCGGLTALCIQDTWSGNTPSVPFTSIMHAADAPNGVPQTVMDCNVFATNNGGSPIRIGSPTSKSVTIAYATPQEFEAAMDDSTNEFPGINGLELNSQSGPSLVNALGVPIALTHTDACAVPDNAIIEQYLTEGAKHYGVTWQ